MKLGWRRELPPVRSHAAASLYTHTHTSHHRLAARALQSCTKIAYMNRPGTPPNNRKSKTTETAHESHITSYFVTPFWLSRHTTRQTAQSCQQHALAHAVLACPCTRESVARPRGHVPTALQHSARLATPQSHARTTQRDPCETPRHRRRCLRAARSGRRRDVAAASWHASFAPTAHNALALRAAPAPALHAPAPALHAPTADRRSPASADGRWFEAAPRATGVRG
mmetsp:Transcript_29843/g.75953  ORF Transcript_29843/g.75953 Transcript_29843/m.75953 type:complete len:226 (+) Transcript_29843:2-679(+)